MRIRSGLAFGSIVLAGCILSGCSADNGALGNEAKGSAEILAVKSSALAADVSNLNLTISGDNIVPSMTAKLVQNGTRWSGITFGIPAGADRLFHGEGLDASGATLYSGDADNVTIAKNQRAFVALVLQSTAPPSPFQNSAPQIASVIASSNTVEPGGTITVSAIGSDPDNDSLAYSWTSTAGAFANPNASSTSFTASGEGTPTLTLRIHDSKGASAAVSFVINVVQSAGTGEASVAASFNDAPTIDGITIDTTPLDVGQTAQLGVLAHDIDGDAITTYAWSSSCVGNFSDSAAANPSFTLAALPANGSSCAFSVRITDARGGWNTGELSIHTGQQASVNAAPTIDSSFQSTDLIEPNQQVVLRIKGRDPEGTALAYAWSANSGTLGTPFINADGESEVVWTAPSCADSALVTATLTDAAGVSTTRAFSFFGSAAATCTHSLQLISVGSSGEQANQDSYLPTVSRNGRYVAFVSHASNLTGHQPLNGQNIYVRDTVSGTTSLVSVSADGTSTGNAWSDWPTISDDGRFIAFRTGATNIVSVPNNGSQVVVRDMQLGVTTLASIDTNGQAGTGWSEIASISGDGRHVCFMSNASLDPSDTNGDYDIYVRDLDANTTRRVSTHASGAAGYCSISYDGSRIAFGTNVALSPNDQNGGAWDTYVRDMQSGSITLVSVDNYGRATGADAWTSISGDGKRVAFVPWVAINSADANGSSDIYIRDLETNAILWATEPSTTTTLAYAYWPRLSHDGDVVAFHARPEAANAEQVYVRTLSTNTIKLLSQNESGQVASNGAYHAAISPDGNFIAFYSYASNLVPGDNNNTHDVFLARR